MSRQRFFGFLPRAVEVPCVVCCLLGIATAAPLDASAQARPAPEAVPSDLQVQALRGGVSVIANAGGNVVVFAGPEGTVLVDSGLAARAGEVLGLLARIAPGPLRFVVNTHGHVDHTGGNALASERGAVVIGHEALRERAGRDAAVPPGLQEVTVMTPAARPVVTLSDTLTLHLNGDRIDALHVADAHTSSDVVLRWASADVVALGDIYWSQQYPAIDLDGGGSLAGMVAAVEGTLARATARTIMVPGHGAPTGRAELAAYRDMLVTVGRRVREAMERGEGLDQILAARPTADFDARFYRAGAYVTPEAFVRTVYGDLARGR